MGCWLHHYLPLPVSPQPSFHWCTKHYFDQTSSSSSHLTRVRPHFWQHENRAGCNGTEQEPGERKSIMTKLHSMLKGYCDWPACCCCGKKMFNLLEWNCIAQSNTWKLLSWNTWGATKHSFRLIINRLIISTNNVTITVIPDHLYYYLLDRASLLEIE